MTGNLYLTLFAPLFWWGIASFATCNILTDYQLVIIECHSFSMIRAQTWAKKKNKNSSAPICHGSLVCAGEELSPSIAGSRADLRSELSILSICDASGTAKCLAGQEVKTVVESHWVDRNPLDICGDCLSVEATITMPSPWSPDSKMILTFDRLSPGLHWSIDPLIPKWGTSEIHENLPKMNPHTDISINESLNHRTSVCVCVCT